MSWGGGEKSGEEFKQTMNNEEVKTARVEASKHNPGEVLHQRKELPFKVPKMALAGFAIVGLIGYGVLFSKKKSEADAIDVARVATNTAKPENTDFPPKK